MASVVASCTAGSLPILPGLAGAITPAVIATSSLTALPTQRLGRPTAAVADAAIFGPASAITQGAKGRRKMRTAAAVRSMAGTVDMDALRHNALHGGQDMQKLNLMVSPMLSGIPHLAPAQITDLTALLAGAGYCNVDFKNVVAGQLLSRMGEFTTDQIAGIVDSFAKVGHFDIEVLSAVMQHAMSHLEQYSAPALGKLLAGFIRLSYNQDGTERMMERMLQELDANFSSLAMAEAVEVFAATGLSDARLTARIMEHAMSNMPEYDAAAVAKLTSGLARMGYDDEELFTALAARAAEVADAMEPEELCKVLWAFGELGYYRQDMLTALVEHALPLALPDMASHHLAVVVNACNKLNYYSPAVASAAEVLSGRSAASG